MANLQEPSTQWGVSRYFGNGHNGIDYKFPANTPVYAAADGVIAFEGYGASHSWITWMGGISILIRHSDMYTGYSHLNKTVINTGDTVKKGQLIGYSGSTGNSTGPHLHFDVLPLTPTWGGTYSGRIDPQPYFTKGNTDMNENFIRRAYYIAQNRTPSAEEVAFHLKNSNPESFLNGFGEALAFKGYLAERDAARADVVAKQDTITAKDAEIAALNAKLAKANAPTIAPTVMDPEVKADISWIKSKLAAILK